mmetsp:Transcript_29290/g.86667  ORF Transcript_29290/g.86667 Transcript_29290/m.86667 type:complete len:81 (+) Transcript_29290:457-699(+)
MTATPEGEAFPATAAAPARARACACVHGFLPRAGGVCGTGGSADGAALKAQRITYIRLRGVLPGDAALAALLTRHVRRSA